MGKLTPEQARQLADLQAQADAPDDDEKFNVQIWDGDKGAEVPFSQAKSWLSKTFGFDLGDPPAGDAADQPAGKDAPPADDGVRRFGRRVS